jgi:LDH2 family malate/lactate/ureidoglycolate dehydrogenase
MEKTSEITLPAEIEKKARARAEREGVTLAEAVRRFLNQ